MAVSNIKQIIDELEAVADAYDAINKFVFGFPSEVNNEPAKVYPMILVSADFNAQTILRDANSGLPSRRQYNLAVTFWDSYTLGDKTTLNNQQKYSAIEIIADRYFAEVNRRTVIRTSPFSTAEFFINNFETLTGTYVQNRNNDKLAGILYQLEIIADNLQCTKGTFSY